MRAKSLMTCVALATVGACSRSQSPSSFPPTANSYFDNAGRDDVLAGGVKMIPVTTPKGTFQVWTKRIGNNPRIKVLLLHGGPGVTHEYLEAFDSYMPGAGIEYYYYDQLGSYYSDQPNEPSLWELPRFVDEVEQGFATETAVVWVDHGLSRPRPECTLDFDPALRTAHGVPPISLYALG